MYDRWEFEEKGKEFQVEVDGSFIFNDSLAALSAALAGQGLIFCVEQLVQDQIEARKLEVVLDPFAIRSGGFYLYYPKRSQALPKLRAFIDHLRSGSKSRKR